MTRLNRFSRLVAFEFSLGSSLANVLYSPAALADPAELSRLRFVCVYRNDRLNASSIASNAARPLTQTLRIGLAERTWCFVSKYSVVRSTTRRLNSRNPRTSGVFVDSLSILAPLFCLYYFIILATQYVYREFHASSWLLTFLNGNVNDYALIDHR